MLFVGWGQLNHLKYSSTWLNWPHYTVFSDPGIETQSVIIIAAAETLVANDDDKQSVLAFDERQHWYLCTESKHY